jgi:hypothetical protein
MLTLFDELFTLSIHEAKGTLISSIAEQIKLALAGAILAELTLLGKIQISNNHRLKLVDDSPVNDDVLDAAVGVLKQADKERKFGYWINALSQRAENTRKQIIKGLIQKGVVTQDEERLVWVIPSPLQADVKASTKYLIIKQLRGRVLAQEELQQRETILLSLIRACGLLDRVFLDDERKVASRLINEMVFGQAIHDPIIQTIQEIETALAAALEED